jgi:hypothetical protein
MSTKTSKSQDEINAKMLMSLNSLAGSIAAINKKLDGTTAKEEVPEVKRGRDAKVEKQANVILRNAGVPQRSISQETVKANNVIPEVSNKDVRVTAFLTVGTYIYLATNGKPSQEFRDALNSLGFGYKVNFQLSDKTSKYFKGLDVSSLIGSPIRYHKGLLPEKYVREVLERIAPTCFALDE